MSCRRSVTETSKVEGNVGAIQKPKIQESGVMKSSHQPNNAEGIMIEAQKSPVVSKHHVYPCGGGSSSQWVQNGRQCDSCFDRY